MKLQVDYANHPAFAPYIDPTKAEAYDFTHFFDRVDRIGTHLFQTSTDEGKANAEYTLQMEPLLREFRELTESDSGIDARLRPRLGDALSKSLAQYADELSKRKLRMTKLHQIPRKGRHMAEFIDHNAYLKFQMAKKWLTPLQKSLQDDIKKLREQFATSNGALIHCNPGAAPHDIVRDFCEKEGIYDALYALFGIRYEAGFALHISHPGDTWFRTFDDLGLPLAQTTDMHYDYAYEVPKAMLYLNEIGPDQGPFSLIPESQQWPDNGSRLAFLKDMYLELQKVGKEQNILPALNIPSFRSVELRKIFASLPPSLRRWQKPGNDILDGTPLSDQLLKKEVPITGEAGTLAIFAGSHTLHRGGLVKSGERWALQICFFPRPEGSSSKKPQKGLLHKKIMKAKKFFRGLGKDSSQKQPSYSEAEFGKGIENLCGSENRITAVDVGGACWLQPHWYRMHPAADYIVYEPHKGSYEDLVRQKEGNEYYSNFTYLDKALAGESGERTLSITATSTGSTLATFNPNSILYYPENDYLFPIRQEAIQTTTLSESLGQLGIKTVDCIKLDTQATELEILRGMGAALSQGLLLVEMEIAVLQLYTDFNTSLETVIPYVKGLGLELFDLRTNRFPGNANRYGKTWAQETLSAPLASASVAQRLIEVDAVFIRDPRHAIDQGMPVPQLRRLLGLLCVYNFFPEALFGIRYAKEKGLLDEKAEIQLTQTVKDLHVQSQRQVRKFQRHLDEVNNENWGQYMVVPYPSA